jgi:3-oxoacyl-[acyl-carrier protein] reductase
MPVTGKVALVTGASRGIGRAIATKLAQMGLTVIGTATTDKGVADIAAHFSSLGLKGDACLLDVTDTESLAPTIDSLQEKHGTITVLINNAGITRDNLMLRMKSEEWDSVINTNLNAIFHLTKTCLKTMLKARWGRIVNISSIVGTVGNPGQANYAAAKAGLEGFGKALAQEVASRNITVNAVAPGFIATDMTEVLSEGQKQLLLERVPLQRLGTPEEIAGAVAYLVSDEAAYMTGQTLHVNGGMFMA